LKIIIYCSHCDTVDVIEKLCPECGKDIAVNPTLADIKHAKKFLEKYGIKKRRKNGTSD